MDMNHLGLYHQWGFYICFSGPKNGEYVEIFQKGLKRIVPQIILN